MAKIEESNSDFLKKYSELRTVLDSLEIFALRYCLEVSSERERKARANKIIKDLQPLIKKYGGTPRSAANACPPGYCLCAGVCVPYDCPEGGGDA